MSPSHESPKVFASPVRIINLRSLDVLRGLVATYVVLGHCRWLLWAGQEAWIKVHHGLPANLLALASSSLRYAHAAVMIFFVLSGFFIHLRVAPALTAGSTVKFNSGEYLKRRAHRLVAPYAFALLVTIAADMVGRHFFPTLYEARTGDSLLDYNFARKVYIPSSILPALVLLPGSLGFDFGTNGPLWSLAYEIVYYLLYPAWLYLRRLGFMTGYGTGLILGALTLWIPQVQFLSPVLLCYPVWLAGAALAEILSRGFHAGFVSLLAGVAALAGFAGLQLSLPPFATIMTYVFLGSGLVCLFACLPERFAASRWHRLGEELGIRGYSIYILHFPLVVLISACAIDRWGGRPLSGWLATGGALLVLGLCLLGFQICERHFLHARLRSPAPNIKKRVKSVGSSLWFCAQIGAREHYAIPRALHQTDRLAALYTDFWAGSVTRSLLPRQGAFGALASRFHPDLAGVPVWAWNLRALTWEARLHLGSNEGGGRYPGYCDVGRRFACAVRDQVSRRSFPPGAIFFAYDTGALETFAALRPRGVRCVLNQMDPNRVEVELVREEEKRWPGWALRAIDVPEAYFRRREQEWALADRIVVNSEFSRQALIRQGVPADKLAVIPLCYEAGPLREGDRREVSRQQSLRVLFLGQVILRKGIQYLMEAAKLLRDEPVHFDVVGPIGISDDAVKSAPPNMTFHGRANRDQAGAWYQQADIFVLPTLSDGFALTQIEAMAHGLPVIATPNCGEVVTDGVDGFIVPPRDAISLAKAVHRYLVEPELLNVQRVAALKKSEQFKLGHLVEKILSLEAELRR